MTAGWRSEARQRLDAAQTEGWFVEFADGAIWTDRGYVGSVLADHRDFIARAPSDLRRALDALDAVLAIHAPIEVFSPYAQPPGMVTVCSGCGDWPCPTVRAIEGET